jgi:phage terminase small subunit
LADAGPLSNSKHEAFCLEWMKDRAGGAAYKRAGYTPKNDAVAAAAASRLLINVNSGVPQRIAELEAKYAAKVGFDTEDALNKYLAVINADPAHLTSLVRAACRYCQGINHGYQWRTEREYQDAVRAFDTAPPKVQMGSRQPIDEGGYGYRATLSPHPDCPECDGFGVPRAHFAGTDSIPEASRPLFAGIKETQHGIEVKMHDQMAALDALAKHIGFFAKDHTRTIEPSDALSELIAGMMLRSSKMPVNSTSRKSPDDDADA